MNQFFSKNAVAAVAFSTALGGSLAAFPLILDNRAFALAAPPEHHFPMASDLVEARLAFARTALKITDAQTKPWNALADVIRKQAKDRDAKMIAMRAEHDARQGQDANPGPNGGFNPIEGMERRQKMMTEQAAGLAEMIAAAKPLYATLSDDQKQVADHLLMMGDAGRPWTASRIWRPRRLAAWVRASAGAGQWTGAAVVGVDRGRVRAARPTQSVQAPGNPRRIRS